MSKFNLKNLKKPYIKIPKKILKLKLNPLSIIAYGILYDNLLVSFSNGHIDENGDIYIMLDDIPLNELLNINRDTTEKIIEELQEKKLILLDDDKTYFTDEENSVIKKYTEYISNKITKFEVEQLNEYEEKYGELIYKAIEVAAINNGKSLRYISIVLRDWERKNLKTVDEVNSYLKTLTTKANKKDTFNNYEQRNYDFDKLEKGLLGY